jgi:hypothetical protein
MPSEIIIGFDESDQSRDAVALGCALADATPPRGAEVVGDEESVVARARA